MSLTREKPVTRRTLDRQRIAELRIQCQREPEALGLHREAIAEFLAGGLPAEALPLLRRLAARCPNDASVATQLATILAASGNDRDALEQWRHVADLEPGSADALHNLGVAACRVADHATASQAFERKLELNPNSFETYNDLAVLYAMTGRPDDAAATYMRCLKINPRYELARKNAFQFFWESGRFEQGHQLATGLLETIGRDEDVKTWQRRFANPQHQAATTSAPHDSTTQTAAGKTTRVHNKKIAFVASSDTFLQPIISHFTPHNQVRIFAGQSVQELAELVRWADLTWFEWCDRFAIDGSKLPRKGKAVCRLHSYEAFTDAPKQMNWSNIDRLILVSESVGEIIDQFWKVPSRRSVIHNGVDSARFPFVERPVRGKKIASVGYINYKKNPSLLLQTFKAIHTHDPEFEFHVAGDHQDPRIKVYMDHLLPRLNIPVTFHGWVKDMPAFYADMDYVISTSLFESFHYSIAEGMLSGCLPLIHSWKGSERLYPGGCFFDTPAQAIQLIERYRDGDTGQIARDHRDYIIKRYEWRDRLDEIDRTLDEVLNGGSGKSPARHPSLTLTTRPKSDADFGRVSIVIAAQDDAACIKDAVTTALNQTYANTEVVVCIDGATDDTEARLAEFADCITVVRQVRRGIPAAFNTAIQHSRGEYIALLRACDAMAPERIEKQVRRLAGSPDLGFVACRVTRIDGDGTGTPDGEALRSLMRDDVAVPPASTLMFRRDLLDHIGWFDESLPGGNAIPLAMRSMWQRMQECAAGKTLSDPLIFVQTADSHGPNDLAISLVDAAHSRWAGTVRSLVTREFERVTEPAKTAAPTRGAKIVFVGASDPNGQMAMWAEAINQHTTHNARVLTHSESTGCPADLVIHRAGHALPPGEKKRSSMAIIEEAAQVAAEADLVVFAAGLAPGCLRADTRLEDTDEQPFGAIDWSATLGKKKRAALLFGTPSVRANLSWYRDHFAAKGWPLLTCEPDIHRWLTESHYIPRLLSKIDERFAPRARQPNNVAVVHPGSADMAPAGIDVHAVAAEIKTRFPHASFGRYQDMPYGEILAMKGSAHIAIDRIDVGAGIFGIDSLENSALGLVNIAYCSPYTRALLAETLGTDEFPWESPATTQALIDVLTAYMQDGERLTGQMQTTKTWFKTYWNDSRMVGRVTDALLNSTDVRPRSQG